MTLWQVAMICLLPLLASASPVKVWRVPLPYGAKLRAWAALIGAGIAARLIGYPDGVPVEVVWTMVDLTAAVIVLWPPKSHAYRHESQRAIGLLFAAMALTNIGFFIAGQMQPVSRDYTGIVQFEALLGWLQWACLLSWGIGDAVERAFRRAWRDSGRPPRSIGAVQ